jgi:hypothetical protein
MRRSMGKRTKGRKSLVICALCGSRTRSRNRCRDSLLGCRGSVLPVPDRWQGGLCGGQAASIRSTMSLTSGTICPHREQTRASRACSCRPGSSERQERMAVSRRAASCGLRPSISTTWRARSRYPAPSARLKPVGLPAEKAPIRERMRFGLVRSKSGLRAVPRPGCRFGCAGGHGLDRIPFVEHQRVIGIARFEAFQCSSVSSAPGN